jgi:aerobic-type carbon monoxide dehydrogenase small subunit (CoxS/CutS family)
MENTYEFTLNGDAVRVSSEPDRMLLWVLRTDFNLTGTKYSCGEGFCGACTVLIDGSPELSCQYPIKNIGGKEVITIEGIKKNGDLHPLQKAFMQHNALQCGFCTPGMILKAYSLLQRNPMPSVDDILESLEGNLCRCGSYPRILQAVQTAAAVLRGKVK